MAKKEIKKFSMEFGKKEKISIFLNGQNADECLREKLSVITHFSQNQRSPFAQTYKDAQTHIKDLYVDKHPDGGLVSEPDMMYSLFPECSNIRFPAADSPKFTFIDLFAGIGGFRIALQKIRMRMCLCK